MEPCTFSRVMDRSAWHTPYNILAVPSTRSPQTSCTRIEHCQPMVDSLFILASGQAQLSSYSQTVTNQRWRQSVYSNRQLGPQTVANSLYYMSKRCFEPKYDWQNQQSAFAAWSGIELNSGLSRASMHVAARATFSKVIDHVETDSTISVRHIDFRRSGGDAWTIAFFSSIL
jgi:hypothetical protein